MVDSMDNKKNKVLMILGIVAIVICVFVFVKFNLDARKAFLVIGDETWGYIDKKWTNIKNTSGVFDKYNFNVYVDKKYQGKYEMKYFNNIWYYFDKENDSHKFDGDIISLAGDRNIDFVNVTIEEVIDSDLENINSALKEKSVNIIDLDKYPVKEKISYDFDGDGVEETVYSINNIASSISEGSVFTAVLYHKNDENKIVIYDDVKKQNEDDLFTYHLNYVVNVNKKNNLILSAGKNLDITSTKYVMYSFSLNDAKKEHESSENYANVNVGNNDQIGKDVAIIILVISVIGVLFYLFIKKQTKEKNKI